MTAADAAALYTAMVAEGIADDRLEPERAHARYLQGKALDSAGRPADALPHYIAAVEHYRGLRSSDTEALAEATHDLAVCLSALNRHTDALPYYTEAVRLRRELLDGRPDTVLELAVCLYNQADNLRDLNRHDRAGPPADEALRLAAELHRTGYADADELYLHALVNRATTSPDLAAATRDLAAAYEVARGTEAEQVVLDALATLARRRTRQVRRAWRAATTVPYPLT